MDIAPLTFRVDSSGAVTAEGDLDELTAAAGRADAAQESLAASAGRAAAAETNMSAKAKAATAAVNAHTAAAKANTAAMNMQAASARAVAGRQQQMMYQTNDIAMSLASGQTPYIVAIQQGSQLAQVYGGPGGLNNAMGDFTKLMRGVIGTLVRFAAPIAAASALAVAAYIAFERLGHRTRQMDDAYDDLAETMEKNLEVMADTHEYSLKIDLARIGREAGDSVDPVDRFANSLTGVAAALNDITVARFMEQATAIGQQIDETEAKIARIESLRQQEVLSPDNTYSATGSLVFNRRLSAEQEVELRNARIQLAVLRDRFEGMGSGALSNEQAEGVFGALLNGDLVGAAEQFRDALKDTLEDPKKGRSTIDEAARAMDRLQDAAAKYADQSAEAGMEELERIQYRRDRNIEAIWETAEAAKAAGNDVLEVNLLANQAEKDARTKAAQDIAALRQRLAEQSLSDIQNDFDTWMRDVERRTRDKQRLADNTTDLNRSLQPGTDMQQVDWWEADANARNEAIWREGVRLYGEAQAERLGLKQQYLDRETAIEAAAAEDRRRIREAQYNASLGATTGFVGAIGQLLDKEGDRRAEAAEQAFAIAKGLNLAQATMNAYVAVSDAWADETLPFWGKVAASITAATSVLQAVAQIRSVTLSGAREMGGPVYAGGTYLVGEKGPELFTPGATGQITSNANLQKAVSGSGGDAQGQTGTLRLIMPEGWRAQMDDTARRLVRVETEAAAAPAKALADLQDDIANGGDTSRIMEAQYALGRGQSVR